MPPPDLDENRFDLDQLLRSPIKYANSLSIKDLEELILVLKDYYYNTDAPLVPDSIFDQVEDVLRERKPNSFALMRIGAPSRGADVPLPYPMASQNKAKAGAGTTEKWMRNYPGPYVVSHKIDGISALLNQDKKLQMFTRGDGIKGQDISVAIRYLDMGSKSIDLPDKKVAIRGELIMTKKIWKEYYEDDYPNVRNFVSGAINKAKKDPQPEDLKRIRFVAYQVIYPEMKPSEQFEYLKKAGFHVAPHSYEEKLTEKELMLKLDFARKSGSYQIDGLIITQDKINQVSDKNPKYSIAFKSQSEEIAQTTVKKVIWKASKRYLLKPTVLIEPVFLSGGNLSKATGHYAKYIVDNLIGPGAVVTIVRSGEVIPYIVKVNIPAQYADLPEIEYEWDDDGLNIRVTEETEEVSHSIVSHMAKTLEIENLGPGTLKKLVEMGYTSPADILNITLEELREVPGLGKNADKIWTSLEKLQTEGVWLSQLMDASSIFEHGIGTRMMQLVIDHHPDILDMANDPKLVSKLVKIKGIERKTAEKIANGLPQFNEFLDEVPHIKIKDEDDESENSEETNPDLEGLRVIFTGVRDKELEKLINASGGTVANTVSKTSTNQVVVAKDPKANSNKLNSARSQGVEILSLAEFKEKYT